MIHGISILTVTSEIACLPAIQSFAREFSKEIGFGPDDQQKILLALEEAVANVIEHAFESAEQTFQIIFEPSAGALKIIIKDKGMPYDPGLLPEYGTPDDIDNIPSRGLGSFIMEQCVDEVEFFNLGREGKELHLVKRLPAKSIIEQDETPETKPDQIIPEAAARISSPPVFEIRLMELPEALEVSRLFYRTYGYSYLSDVMYYPERIAEANREGFMCSVVAVTGHGEIVGHLAMFRDTLDDKIAETGKGAVKESFRGFDLFTRMQEFVNERAEKVGLKGLYGRAVTVHAFSQKMTEKTGYKDCAILLGVAPADMSFKGIEEKLPQRETCVYCFQAVTRLPVTSVYLPPNHETIIRKIYANLGLTRDFIQMQRNAQFTDLTVLNVKVHPETNGAEIVIQYYGEDYVKVLRDHVRDLCVRKIDHITLLLNLGDPVTSRICPEIEKLGFFMAGIVPCLYFEDTLILQYLNNIIIDFSRIKIHSDMTKEIAAYIAASMR